eukprot:455272_1
MMTTFAIGDEIEFNSDPDDVNDEKSHIYRGRIQHIKAKNNQITIQHNDHCGTHTYFMDEIHIKKVVIDETKDHNDNFTGEDKEVNDVSHSFAHEIDNLPRHFFFYGTVQDNAANTEHAGPWTNDFVTDCIEARTANLYGYKMYQNISESYPFLLKTNNPKQFIIGRLMKFKDDKFYSKLKHSDHINGYSPDNDSNKNLFTRCVVNVYLENDKAKTKPISAISYVQKRASIDLNECIVVESNDWVNKERFKYLNDTKIFNMIINILCAYFYKMREYNYYSKYIDPLEKQYYRIGGIQIHTMPNDDEFNQILTTIDDDRQRKHLYFMFPSYITDINIHENKLLKIKTLHIILNSIYEHVVKSKCVPNIIEDIIPFRWQNVPGIIYQHFYPKLAIKAQIAIQESFEQNSNYNIDETSWFKITNQLKIRNGLTNQQTMLLRFIVNKYKYYKPEYESFSFSLKSFFERKWNEQNDERKLWEIYSVHQAFINHNNPAFIYNSSHFCHEIKKLNMNDVDIVEHMKYPEKFQLYLCMNKTIDIH